MREQQSLGRLKKPIEQPLSTFLSAMSATNGYGESRMLPLLLMSPNSALQLATIEAERYFVNRTLFLFTFHDMSPFIPFKSLHYPNGSSGQNNELRTTTSPTNRRSRF